jgi:hypothetical protein
VKGGSLCGPSTFCGDSGYTVQCQFDASAKCVPGNTDDYVP